PLDPAEVEALLLELADQPQLSDVRGAVIAHPQAHLGRGQQPTGLMGTDVAHRHPRLRRELLDRELIARRHATDHTLDPTDDVTSIDVTLPSWSSWSPANRFAMTTLDQATYRGSRSDLPSSRRRSLPVSPRGRLVTSRIVLGTLKPASVRAQWARSPSPSASIPARSTTLAITASPHSGSAMPNTAAS